MRGENISEKSIQLTGLENSSQNKGLERLQTFKEKIIDNANIWISVHDTKNNVLFWNKTAEEISGYTKEEVLENNEIFQWLYPQKEDRKKILNTIKEAIEKGKESAELEETIQSKRDKEKIISWNFQILENDNGETVGYILIGRDITKSKKIKEREESLHSLLRHDVLNKAQSIQIYLELLEDSDLSDEDKETLREAINTNQGIINLIEKVRTLRKIGREESEEVDLDSTRREAFNISSILKVLGQVETKARKRGIQIEIEDLDCKVISGPLLEEVFSNLIENAIKHSDGSKVRISAEETDDKCIITVEDDGKGIPDEEKNKVFEKGFKKGKESGSGLGLTIVKGIIENYGGEIEVKDSELGGARFDIHLEKAS